MSKIVEKILLIHPPTKRSSGVSLENDLQEPLALLYIAAAIPGGSVEILDMRIEGNLKATLLSYHPQLVGITGYSCHVKEINNIAREIKAFDSAITVMVGGHHATVQPVDFDIPEIDCIVIGEGCTAIKELFDNNLKFVGINGLAYRENGKLVYNAPRIHPPLDILPLPRRDLVKKYRNQYHRDYMYDLASIRSSLGCPYRCKFCALWNITGGRYLERDIDDIVAELKSIPSQNIFFIDDESMIHAARMTELARKIKKEGIDKRYLLFARADTVVKQPDLFKIWRGIGLEKVGVGYESFTDSQLSVMNKKLTIDIQKKATQILNDLGIIIEAFFIVEPRFNRKDFKLMQEHVRSLNLMQVGISIQTPMPGTQLFEEQKGIILTNDLNLYSWSRAVVPTLLPEKEFYQLYFQTIRKSVNAKNKWRNLMLYPPEKIPARLWLAVKERLRDYNKTTFVKTQK